MKTPISRWLCRHPKLYLRLLGLRRYYNAEKAAYLRLIKQGDTVIEVGANTGYFTGLFSEIVGDSGRVIAFEPIPTTRSVLSENLRSLGAKNVNLLPFALSDAEGEAEMHLPGDVHGQASLKTHPGTSWTTGGKVETHAVACRRLDQVGEVTTLERVMFIKVDAEGAELPVLCGGEGILKRDHPILHLEIEPAWMMAFDYTAQDLERYLRGIGYQFFATYGKDWQHISSLSRCKVSTNVVCSAKSLIAQDGQ